MSRTTTQLCRAATRVALCAFVAFIACRAASAQSGDLSAPTPVIGGEIAGRITALDIGDARLTSHFYTFGARPGDLELTVESNNLEGDIDLFAAGNMRPLSQVTLYAGLNSTVTRTVFFRRDETVILRVQARTPGDADGTYRIRLGGTFAPSTAPMPVESAGNAPVASDAAREKTARGNTRRVNSIGARIEEPKPEATPVPVAPSPSETTSATAPTAANSSNTKGATTRRPTTRRGTTRRGTTQPSAASTESAKAEPSTSASAEPSAKTENTPTESAPTKAGTNRARGSRTPRAKASNKPATTNTASPSTEAAAPASAEPASPGATALGLESPGSRLILEMRGGERIVREMSEVRRVSVEGRFVVIFLKNGRVERQQLADVARMSIEP
ncbi:MAG: hypothetical protein ACJ741_12500 [Pyrinomonadaceae bacterium]